jgi:hypothetical protein
MFAELLRSAINDPTAAKAMTASFGQNLRHLA